MTSHSFRTPLAAVLAASLCLAATAAGAATVKNIVLVHGAFVDGSGWRPVYDILTKDGYKVSIVQQPLTGLADDVTATKRILDRQDGPAILVAHSYGGAIITAAGSDPHVAGLVYIAAHALDEGETESGNGKKYPASAATRSRRRLMGSPTSTPRAITRSSAPTCRPPKPPTRPRPRASPPPASSPRRSRTRRGS